MDNALHYFFYSTENVNLWHLQYSAGFQRRTITAFAFDPSALILTELFAYLIGKMKTRTLVAGFFILTVFLPLLAILSVVSVIFQLFVLTNAKIFHPDLSHIFAGGELLYAIESIYTRPKVSTVVHSIFDGQIQLDYVRQQFEHRILHVCDPEGNLLYRKLRQSWTQLCGYRFWKWEKDFSLKNHVRLYDYTEPQLAIPSPCTEEDLRRVTGTLITTPYAKGQSPWEMLLIPDYQFVNTNGETCIGSVLTLKIHHCLADGFSVFKLLYQLYNMNFPALSAKFRQLSALQRVMRTAVMVLSFPFDVVKIMISARDDPNYWHIMDTKLSRQYVTLTSDRIPMATIKAIKNKHSVSYNTAVYAIIGGAISRFMKAAGQKVPKTMASYTPLPLPNHPGGLVNHWYAATTFDSFFSNVDTENFKRTGNKFS